MKRLLLLSWMLFAGCLAQAQSRIETFTVKSALLGCDKVCSVYLPADYDSAKRSYPVLYLLHGASDTHAAWAAKGNVRQIADETAAEGTAQSMIIVMPDASGEGEYHTGLHMGYFNVEGWSYEDFFFTELMPAVEQHYRIRGDKAHRAIAGLSMGGGGAVVYAMHHPEVFGSACSLSGLLDGFPGPRNDDSTFIQSVIDQSPVTALEHLTDADAERLRTVRWWADCGDDDFLFFCNIRFYTLMRHRNIPLQYRMRDGNHTWAYWQTGLRPILGFISVGFGE